MCICVECVYLEAWFLHVFFFYVLTFPNIWTPNGCILWIIIVFFYSIVQFLSSENQWLLCCGALHVFFYFYHYLHSICHFIAFIPFELSRDDLHQWHIYFLSIQLSTSTSLQFYLHGITENLNVLMLGSPFFTQTL